MILPLSSCYNKENREEILKVYNWGDYIDEDILAEFPKWYEEQTGKKIRVIYQTFDINEVMLTKIERGHEDYDVVCPSEYIIERMLRKDLLLPIDTAFGKTPELSQERVAIHCGADRCNLQSRSHRPQLCRSLYVGNLRHLI